MMESKERNVDITNRDKILFPNSGINKGQLIDYYRAIAPMMIKYSFDHPITLHRFPNGIDDKNFMQKNVSAHFPSWIPRVKVDKQGGQVEMAMINDSDTLTYLSNQGTIVFHSWLSKSKALHFPTRLVIDLDPSDNNFKMVVKAAKTIRKIYDELELPCYLMTTGSKGLHIITPLSGKESFVEVKNFAKTLCSYIAGLCPNETTVEVRKDKRLGRVFLDYLRNSYAQTAVAPYSVRAIDGAPVATPLFCEELDHKNMHSQYFNVNSLLKRIESVGDPWDGFNEQGFSVKKLFRKMETIIDNDV
jgi:bifunctional non-homologous end joining protein LigD